MTSRAPPSAIGTAAPAAIGTAAPAGRGADSLRRGGPVLPPLALPGAPRPIEITDRRGTPSGSSQSVQALRGASPLAFAGMLATAVNVGVTLLIARMLTTRGYGALAQLIALFFVLSMPGSALLIGVVRRVTAWRRAGRLDLVAHWVRVTRRRALVLVIGFSLLAVALRGVIGEWMNLPSPAGVAETLSAGAVWGLLSLDRGLLQAGHAYPALGRNLIVEGLSRCMLTVGLVAVGMGVQGATLAILISVILADLDARRSLTALDLFDPTRIPADQARAPGDPVVAPAPADAAAESLAAPPAAPPPPAAAPAAPIPAAPAPAPKVAREPGPAPDQVAEPGEAAAQSVPPLATSAAVTAEPTTGSVTAVAHGEALTARAEAVAPPTGEAHSRRSLTVDVGTALGALALLGVLQNIDVVLLGRAAPGNAGPYAAISVATKLLVLAALVLSSFLLPEAAARRHLGQHALHQLAATLAILAVPAALLMTVSFLAPRQLLGLAFGGRLTAAAPAFATLAVAMSCLAMTVLFTHYLLAVGRRRTVLLLLAGAVVTAVLIAAGNGAPLATARADLIAQAALAAITGASVLHAARKTVRVG